MIIDRLAMATHSDCMVDDNVNGPGPENKAERLALAGVVAPFLRESVERTAKRRVARVDESGNVVGYTTLAEVQKALLKRHQIEIDVQPGVKAVEVPCPSCGLPIKKPKTGCTPKRCLRCKLGNQKHCAGFNGEHCRVAMPAGAMTDSAISHRKGRPWLCRSCARRKEKKSVSCAGYAGFECTKVAGPEVLKPRSVRSRQGAAWRCKACHDKQRAVKQIKCAGYEGHECHALSSVHGTRNARRKKDAWRCKPCSDAHRRLSGDKRRLLMQAVCAGFEGYTCTTPVPSYALSRSARVLRKGEPWRCKHCSTRDPEYRKKRKAVARKLAARADRVSGGGSVP